MKSFLSCLVLFLSFSPFASSQGVTSYQLAELIPYSWVELAPGSLNGTQIYVNDSCFTVNTDKARNISFFGSSYNKFVASRQGFLSFVPSVCTSSALDAATNPSGECPYPLSAIGTGIAMFYGYTTQLNPSSTDPPSKEYYKYFTTCPYPGLAEFGGCHVIEYVASQWTGFVKSIAVTTEVFIGDNGAVVMQWKDQNPNLWLGALVGVGSTTGAGFVVSYPRGVQNRQCPWGNSSTTPLLALDQKAISFYPLNVPMPCDSDHNITFTNSDGERGCTCEDFDGDGFVCPENDACPFDGTKWTSAGVCGCGVSDVDSDGDGTPDCVDACPSDPNKWVSAGLCGCGQLDYEPGSYALTCGDASSLSSWLSQLKYFFLL